MDKEAIVLHYETRGYVEGLLSQGFPVGLFGTGGLRLKCKRTEERILMLKKNEI